jgi:hypothetical protein
MKAKLFLAALLVLSCAGGSDQKLEQVQFLLDHGLFSQAAVKAREIVATNPANTEGQFLLASALLGDATLNKSVRCRPEDIGYLGLLACLLDDKKAGESAFCTFARIAPDTTVKLDELLEARSILIGLPATISATRQRDTYLQLYMARLFDISAVTTVLGVGSTSFNPNALDTAGITRFQDDLANVNDDGTNAGLPKSFGLDDRVTELLTKLTTAIETAGGNMSDGAAAFFSAQFGTGVCS